MNKVTVTYRAPPGESKVTEIFGHTFFDGKAETIEVDDRVLTKLQSHAMFDCGPIADQPGEDKPPVDSPPSAEPPKEKESGKRPAKFPGEEED
jgi:hypothetical protein